jgi:hypothetical protein
MYYPRLKTHLGHEKTLCFQADEYLYSAAYFCRMESAFDEMYLWGLTATRPDARIPVCK